MSSARSKVLLIGPYPPPDSGTSIPFRAMVEYIREVCGVGTFVLSTTSGVKVGMPLFSRKVLMAGAAVLGRMVKNLRPYDLVVVNGSKRFIASMGSFFALFFALFLKSPVAVYVAGGNFHIYLNSLPILPRAFVRFCLLRARIVAVQTRSSYGALKSVLPNVILIPNWVETGNIPSREPPASTPSQSPIRFIYVGEVRREKGVRELLAAFQELRSNLAIRGNPATLDIFGPLRPEFESVWESLLRGAEGVTYHGYVLNRTVLRKLREFDVLVMPTLFETEGHPGVLIEAMAAGLPVVTTRSGGIPEIIREGENGLLCEPGDVAGLAAAMERLACNPEFREKIGLAAQETSRGFDTRVVLSDFCRRCGLSPAIHQAPKGIWNRPLSGEGGECSDAALPLWGSRRIFENRTPNPGGRSSSTPAGKRVPPCGDVQRLDVSGLQAVSPHLIRYQKGVMLYVGPEGRVWAEGKRLFLSRNGWSQSPLELRFPLSFMDEVKALFPASRRFFRWRVYHFRPLGVDSWVAMAFGRIYRAGSLDGEIKDCGPIVGNPPAAVCQCPDNGNFYYGEYRGNSERSPVHIWGSADEGGSWQPVYAMKGVRHIHGVYYDPYLKMVWVTTGDEDRESGLWVTGDHFRTLQKIVGGSQQTRAIQLLFTEKFVYFASDSPHERNYICRLDRQSARIEKLQELGSSVFYGTQVGEQLFFGTVAEPSRVNETQNVMVWRSKDGEDWDRFVEFKKDFWPHRLFQYGQVFFPEGRGDGRHLWLTPYSCRGDQVSLCYDLYDGQR